MILGVFDQYRRPFIWCRVIIPRLRVDNEIRFLIDTGADMTAIHVADTQRFGSHDDDVTGNIELAGIEGGHEYSTEEAILLFDDGALVRGYAMELAVARPPAQILPLPSIIGRPLLNKWRMRYDPWGGRLEVIAKDPDISFRGSVEEIPRQF